VPQHGDLDILGIYASAQPHEADQTPSSNQPTVRITTAVIIPLRNIPGHALNREVAPFTRWSHG
jgi:hypothetical protein